MREVPLKAGERTKILGLMTRNLSTRVEFDVEAADGAPPRGIIETSHGSVIAGRKSVTQPLLPTHVFEKPWNQHGYHIHITSETDATVRFRTQHIRDTHIYWAMAAMTVLAVVVNVVLTIMKR